MEKLSCVVTTWDDIYGHATTVSEKIKKSGFYPDVVIGLSRGGLVPARLICDFLHIKNCFTLKVDHWGITASKDGEAKLGQKLNMDLSGKKVLVVDDITDTGQSMGLAINHMKELNAVQIKTATLIHLNNSNYVPDFFGFEREWSWIIFPWNYKEDIVNLIKKIINEHIPEEIKDKLRTNFNLDINIDYVKEILEHINYLNKVNP